MRYLTEAASSCPLMFHRCNDRKAREEKARAKQLALERDLEMQRTIDPYAPTTKVLRSSIGSPVDSDSVPAVKETRTMQLRHQAFLEKRKQEEVKCLCYWAPCFIFINLFMFRRRKN